MFSWGHLYLTLNEPAVDALDWGSPVLEGIDLAGLRQTGFARLKVGSPDDFVPHREGNFPTPPGKPEFKSSMAGVGNRVLPLFRQGYAAMQSG